MKFFLKKIIIKIKFKNLIIKKKAIVSLSSYFEGNNIINKGANFSGYLGFGSYIGEDCIINAKVGKFCSIASNVVTVDSMHPINFISTHPAFYSLSKQAGFTFVSKQLFEERLLIDKINKISINIGNDVWIGQNVMLKGGIKIGDGAIIGMGAVVTKDVPPYAIVGGVPAKIIKYRFNEEQIKYLLDYKWWDKDVKWLSENVEEFSNLDNFVNIIKKDKNKK